MRHFFATVLILMSAIDVAQAQTSEDVELEEAVSLKPLPQLTADRGGSLGLVSPGAESSQGSLDTNIFNKTPNINLFVKLGGLSLTDRGGLDIFAENFTQDIPRYRLGGSAIKREFTDANIAGAGVRGRYVSKGLLLVSEDQSDNCIEVLGKQKSAGKDLLKEGKPITLLKKVEKLRKEEEKKTALVTAAEKDFQEASKSMMSPPPNSNEKDLRRAEDATWHALAMADGNLVTAESETSHLLLEIEKLEECRPDEWLGERYYAVNFGVRVLRRVPAAEIDDPEEHAGYAIELIGQYIRERRGYGMSFSAGLSAMGLRSSSEKNDSLTDDYPRFNQARLSLNLELRAPSFGSKEDITPRAGIYAVGGHAWWHDPYPSGKINPRAQGSELEIGLYAGGKFAKSFYGMVAFRVVRSYRKDEGNQYILSLIPSAGE